MAEEKERERFSVSEKEREKKEEEEKIVPNSSAVRGLITMALPKKSIASLTSGLAT